jgi:nucleotide-binding universal stress UspA family protein
MEPTVSERVYRHIAVCIDRSEASVAALEEARSLRATTGGGRLTMVHVAPWPLLYTGEAGAWAPDPADIAAAAREWLDGVAAGVPEGEAALLDGYPPAAVCEWAESNDVDLIVAASHRGLVERVLLGSFAGYLVRNAPCSVLLTRPEAAAAKPV